MGFFWAQLLRKAWFKGSTDLGAFFHEMETAGFQNFEMLCFFKKLDNGQIPTKEVCVI